MITDHGTLLALPWVKVATRADLDVLAGSRRPAVLVTPPGLVESAGPGWLPALLEATPVGANFIPLNDCGGAAGYALASLNFQIGVTLPDTVPEAQARVARLAASLGLPALCQRCPAVTPADFLLLEP